MGRIIVPKNTNPKGTFMIRLGTEAFSLRGLAETVEEIHEMLVPLIKRMEKKK